MSDNSTDVWATKVAVREVIEEYCIALIRGDWERYEALFTSDAVWDVGAPINLHVQGGAAIRETVSSMTGGADVFLQFPHVVVVTVLGPDQAKATSAVEETFRHGGDEALRMYGLYDDEFVRTDDGWKFSSRRFQLIQMGGVSMPGDALMERGKQA